jgi:hypothetical protein
MKSITIILTNKEFARLDRMRGNDFDPNQTIEELVLELLADCLPWLRRKYWPKNRLEDICDK